MAVVVQVLADLVEVIAYCVNIVPQVQVLSDGVTVSNVSAIVLEFLDYQRLDEAC